MFGRRELFLCALAPALLAGAASAQAPMAPHAAPATGVRVRRLAWAGIALRAGDVEVFIDARAPSAEDGAPGPALASDAGRCFALVTHHHGDHLDLHALQPLLGETGYLVAEDDVARMFDQRVVNVQTVRMFEPVFLSRGGGEFVAWAVPASDGLGSPQVSWVLDGGGQRVIHCGDTLWHGGLWDIARAYGPFDAAFLPINGARQVGGRYTDAGEPIVMSAEQAAAAAQVLGARLAVPIHYGAPPSPGYVEQPEPERHFLAAAATRGVHTRVLRPGESLTLS
jgi:L-ascorbate metabolism protein UlaG (beta-lactamase superfamily)